MSLLFIHLFSTCRIVHPYVCSSVISSNKHKKQELIGQLYIELRGEKRTFKKQLLRISAIKLPSDKWKEITIPIGPQKHPFKIMFEVSWKTKRPWIALDWMRLSSGACPTHRDSVRIAQLAVFYSTVKARSHSQKRTKFYLLFILLLLSTTLKYFLNILQIYYNESQLFYEVFSFLKLQHVVTKYTHKLSDEKNNHYLLFNGLLEEGKKRITMVVSNNTASLNEIRSAYCSTVSKATVLEGTKDKAITSGGKEEEVSHFNSRSQESRDGLCPYTSIVGFRSGLGRTSYSYERTLINSSSSLCPQQAVFIN
uniref:NTR domain-containing protein n=1 Tax=Heterorhabditis bacteriophora TaxID=37862 RepID=A0A1I7WHD4_HETBA